MSRKCSIDKETTSVYDYPISIRDEIIQLQSRLLVLRAERLILKLKRNDNGQWEVVKSDRDDIEEIQSLILKIAELKKNVT